VKLPIVKYLSNKLPILSKAIYILAYTGSETTKDSTNQYQQSTKHEKTNIASILREEYKELPISVYSKPCDSQSRAAISKLINSFILSMLSKLILYYFFYYF